MYIAHIQEYNYCNATIDASHKRWLCVCVYVQIHVDTHSHTRTHSSVFLYVMCEVF